MSLGSNRISQRAPHRGALAVWGALLCALFSVAATAGESSCRVDAYDETVFVRHVVDGDTVVLEDGRHVRLIGFNAPERAKDDRPAEPYAAEARQVLQRLIARSDESLRLKYGPERLDRYGRTLAHLSASDGNHLGAELLRRGLAFSIAIPPNLGFQSCLREAEKAAREQRTGVWGAERFAARRIAELETGRGGFYRVRGVLDGVGFSRDSLWLQIDGRLGIRIHKAHLQYFRRWNFHALRGQRIEVRGWISPRKSGWRMSLKHPNDLEILDR